MAQLALPMLNKKGKDGRASRGEPERPLVGHKGKTSLPEKQSKWTESSLGVGSMSRDQDEGRGRHLDS